MHPSTCNGAFILSGFILVSCLLIIPQNTYGCSFKWNDPNSCYHNMYLIDGAYCFNNGSGICKVLAGRFEFYYDTFNDKFIGPAPKSEFVDEFGYHQRVPVSYNITGHINYVDKSINWARLWAKKQAKKISLLSSTSFNWCRLAVNNWWPYKSAIRDPTNKYHIFFYNRQSCIYDSSNNDTENAYQHFNTRFLHNTSLRIDLDMNPTIFTMEDKYAEANKIRLVKHMRQHWYEVEFEVLVKPSDQLNYFVKMKDVQTEPCKIDGKRGGLITKSALDEYNGGRCMNDSWHTTRIGKNSPLFPTGCGVDKKEIADLPIPYMDLPNLSGKMLLEVDLHNLPRYPIATTSFYGVDVDDDDEWQEFAKDGFVFSATTTVPIDSTTVNVIMFYANFKVSVPQTYSDEHYPLPMIASYKSKLNLDQTNPRYSTWEFDRESNSKSVKTLNYVDDIAYLHQCQSILVILGPLYSEMTPEGILDVDNSAPVDSIYSLGIFELANSFFAVPDSDTLWVYHRANYMTDHNYKCQSGLNGLVSATKGSGKYYPRDGQSQPPFLVTYSEPSENHFEETFFQDMGIFKGSLDSPEAPDPDKYPLGNLDVDDPIKPEDKTWIYVLVGVAILIILALCIICMFAMRARRRHRKHGLGRPTERSSFLDSILSPFSGFLTRRSALSSQSSISGKPTNRTSLHSSRSGSSATRRSGLKPASSRHGSRSSSKTRRTSISLPPKSLSRSRSSSPGSNTKRSSSLKEAVFKNLTLSQRAKLASGSSGKTKTHGSNSRMIGSRSFSSSRGKRASISR